MIVLTCGEEMLLASGVWSVCVPNVVTGAINKTKLSQWVSSA